MPDPTPDEVLDENAVNPKSATVDGQSVEQHPLRDQIEWARYRKAGTSTATKRIGLINRKIEPDGAI